MGTFTNKAQRQRELEKELRDKEEASLALESFKRSFLPDKHDRPKPWVTAGVLNPETGVERGTKRKLYLPPKAANNRGPAAAPAKRTRRFSNEEPKTRKISEKERARMMKAAKGAAGGLRRKKSKTRNIDLMIRENEASRRAEKVARGMFGGVIPPNVPKPGPQLSTNLYVQNLPKETKKPDLKQLFGRFGPIDSLKIYEPRSEEERLRKGTIGFVSFLQRADAEAALDALNGKFTWGTRLVLRWGNPVKRTATPIGMGSPAALMAAKLMQHHPTTESIKVPETARRIVIALPSTAHIRSVIDQFAIHVAKDGMVFENIAISRQRGNRDFEFLFNVDHPNHFYYRWRVISLCFGDSLKGWRESPFQLIKEGPWWIPPKVDKLRVIPPAYLAATSLPYIRPSGERLVTGSGSRGPIRSFDNAEHARFTNMLRHLTNKRHSVRNAMAFCLDNSDRATEVVEIITESLTILKTKVHKKLARLYLVSDILHNSTCVAKVKNASAYRSEFQKRLLEIFKSIKECHDRLEDAEVKQNFAAEVQKILLVWERWSLFPIHFVQNLDLCLNPRKAEEEKQELAKESKSKKPEMEDFLAMALEGDVGANEGDDVTVSSVDGEPMGSGVDGEPMESLDGEEMDGGVDGEPMEDGDSMDEEEISGEWV